MVRRIPKVLSHKAQTLTEAEKAQARSNIGLSDVLQSKGKATVEQLNNTEAQVGWCYRLLDGGTLTDGSLVVSAGDVVSWDGTEWFKLSGVQISKIELDEQLFVNGVDGDPLFAARAERDQYGNKLILDQKDLTYQSPQYVSGLGYHVNLSGAPEGLSARFLLRFHADSSDTDHVQSLAETHTVIEFTLSTADWTSYMVFSVVIEDTEVPLKNLPPILYKGAHILIDIQGGVGVVNVLYPGQINDVQVIEYGATDINTKRAIDNVRRMKPLLCHFQVVEDKIDPTPTTPSTYYPMYAILEKPYVSVSPEGGHVNGCSFIAYHTVVHKINGYPASFTAGTRVKIVITCEIVDDALTWKMEFTPANECFLATFGTTTFAEMMAAHNAGLPVFAIHDDQQYGLTLIAADNSHPGYRALVFSGTRRSWMPQDAMKPCMGELICLEYENQWVHQWYPLTPMIQYGTGTVDEVNAVLTAGLVPVCKRTTSYGYSLEHMVGYQATDQSYLFANNVILHSDGTWSQ